MKKFFAHKYPAFFLLLFLGIFTFLSFFGALHESLTFDELVDLQEGRNAVLFHTFNIDPYNPPLTRELGIFPYIFSSAFYQSDIFAQNYSLPGRMVMILIGISLLASVFLFTKKQIGEKEALLAVFLLSLEPNMIANSHYITMDIGLTAIMFLSFILFLRFLHKQNLQNTLLLSLAVGLGMVTKISYIPYFFLSAIFILFLKNKHETFHIMRKLLPFLFFAIIAVLVVIWSTYFFSTDLIIKKRIDTNRVSVKTIQFAQNHHVPFLADTILFFEKTKVPFGDYLATIKNNALRSVSRSTCFSLGTFYPSCRWYFMIETMFLKIPLPLLILFGVSLVTLFRRKKENEITIYLLIFSATMIIVAIVFRLAPLIRYILPVIPFVTVAASTTVSFWLKTSFRKIIFTLLLIWYVVSILLTFPHFITYANELAFNQKSFFLTDSNMDWGQNLPDVEFFLRQHRIVSAFFSYSGRDNGESYGLKSNKPYGSYKANEICEFHQIGKPMLGQPVFIGSTNWYNCGYYKNSKFAKNKIVTIIADTVFVFQK